MSVDETSALLEETRDDDARARWRLGRWAVVVGGAFAVVEVAAAAREGGLGAWRGVRGKLLPRTPRNSERAGAGGPLRRVTLYDHCMDDATKLEGVRRDFWTTGREGARVVRHNFGHGDFFSYKKGIPLERRMIDDGLYAWTLETRDFDWEYGFALGNVAGKQYYDIGSVAERAPLAREDNFGCVQRYGKYFNRVVTNEIDPVNISYVFGSCLRECPPGYKDYSMVPKPVSGELPSIATDPTASVDLGDSPDARLVIPSSVMFLADTKNKDVGMNPHLRTGLQKDTTFAESKNAVRWIVGGIDYWRMYLKMAKIEIYLENGRAKVRFISQTRHTLGPNKGYPYRSKGNKDWRVGDRYVDGCTNVFCDPMQYDLSTLYGDSGNTEMTQYIIKSILYRSLKLGDSAPTLHRLTTGIQSEPNCAVEACTSAQRQSTHFLEGTWSTGAYKERTLFPAGKWGPDVDVRRLTITSGVLCSTGQNMGHCMFAIARAFDPGSSGWQGYTGPTRTRKQYILASLVGAGWKLARVEVFVDGGALKIKALDTVLDHYRLASDHDAVTGDGVLADISAKYRLPARTDKLMRTGALDNWLNTNGQKMGVGGVYYELAGSMVPSLVGLDQVVPLDVENQQ